MRRGTNDHGRLALVGGVVALLGVLGLMGTAIGHDSTQGGVGTALAAASWLGLLVGIVLVAVAVVRSSR
ncbi:hypothetical protein [Blastococcus saxobsidens]|uniref:Uncharacterized protein n=1 Tax=Blastococcus saxobsidens TaxID=138336 RepID=A0A4Q7Y4D5_9ACTN|nr:hypothetical protein [Blastococcus saxobsidens]RZU30903.1 hypothetical protein BKA19_0538 [Blastococcus saxobsidens]